MRWYQRLSFKLALVVVAVVGISLAVIAAAVNSLIYERLRQDAENARNSKVAVVQQDLNQVNSLMQEQVRAAMRVLKRESQIDGEPSLGASVQIADKEVPNLLLGKITQANNFALVDKVKELMGGTATLFVKSGEDFVRVSTNVQKADGSRAVGTTLDPNGKAIKAVQKGQAYYGVVNILERPYITGYEPIKNQMGEIVGVWYVGYPLGAVEELGRQIQGTSILQNGFVALTDDKGKPLFKSNNVSNEVLTEAITAKTTAGVNGWNVKTVDFEPWGYQIVSAYASDDPEFANQVQAFQNRIILGFVLLTLLLAAVIYFLMRRFTRSLEDAARAADQIAKGNLDVQITARGNDEVGQMARSMNGVINYLQEMSGVANQIAAGNLNVVVNPRSDSDSFGLAFKNMVERTLRLVQTQDERDRLQAAIMKLLNEVADVASGDLTAEAEVTADATGAIADAFNYMIVELRGIIGRVKQTSLQVDGSASEIRHTTETLMHRSENQSVKLLELSATLEKMANAMQSVAQETSLSARVSDSALLNAKQGTMVVNNNIQAMNRLRSRVQETSERIKRLGDRSQEISSIVKIINDLAQRTSVLALNASIQATAAGAAGRGFVAVAEEVERLAERSATASKQIDVLTKAIQGETNEAVVAMELTVKEVAAGVRLTGEVGTTLGELETVTNHLALINQEIARAAREQAEDSVGISTQMRSVASVSHSTAAEVKHSADNVNQLEVWATELRSSVASFRLPEKAQAA